MDKIDDYQLIEDYLLDRLDAGAREAVERRLAIDPAFARSLGDFRKALAAIRKHGLERQRELLVRVEQELDEEAFFLTDDDLIAFLRETADPEMARRIKTRIAADPALARRIDLLQQSLDQIEKEGRKRSREALAAVEAELEQEGFFGNLEKKTDAKVRRLGGRRLLAVAATLLVLLSVALYLIFDSAPQTPLTAYHTPFEDKLSDELAETGFVTIPYREVLAAGMKAYATSDYPTARVKLTEFRDLTGPETPYYREAGFYLSEALVEEKDLDGARRLLTPLAADDEFEFQQPARWSLALLLLETKEDMEQARQLLTDLKQNPEYAERAARVLNRYF